MDTQMMTVIVALLVGAAISWVVYTALIWILLRIQGLNYTIGGIIASTITATLVSLIPFVGIFLAAIVLIACLAKVTKASIAPDLIFTVMISNGLMFCFNLFLLGSLMGDLRPSARGVKYPHSVRAAESRPAPKPKADRSSLSGFLDKARSTLKKTGDSRSVSNRRQPVQEATLALKGISYGKKVQIAMISYGQQVHTVGIGDVCRVETPKGSMSVRCEAITRTSVRLTVDGGETVELKFGP